MSDDIVVVVTVPRVGDGVRDDIAVAAGVVETSLGVVCTLGVETCLTEGVVVVTGVVCISVFVEDTRTDDVGVLTRVVVAVVVA